MRWLSAILLPLSMLASTGMALPNHPKVWVFETHLTGAMNQRLGLAERLSSDIEVLVPPAKDDPITPEEYLRAFLKDRYDNPAAWPDVVINTEEWKHEVNLMLDIRRLAPKKVLVIHLENPRHRNDEFDLIVNASHLPRIKGSNVMQVLGVSSWITPQKLEEARTKWEPRFSWMKKPLIFVAIGGQSEFNPYHPEYAKDLGERLKKVAKANGGSLLIATSRRTPLSAVEALMRELTGVSYFMFDWNRDPAEENPYAAGLALGDYFVVTGDSLSMMSDVVALGKPLYIHAPNGSLRPEHPRMIEDLYVKGIARPFTGNELKTWNYKPINVADSVVQEIKKRFCEEDLN